MRLGLLLVIIFSISFVSAIDVNFLCPNEVYFNETFVCSIEVVGIDSSYDLKADILSDGKRISQIFDDVPGKWKSTNYYVNNFIISEGKKDVQLRITSEFTGNASGVLKLRQNGKTAIDYTGNFSINVGASKKQEQTSTTKNNQNESPIIHEEPVIERVTSNKIDSAVISEPIIVPPSESIIKLNSQSKYTAEVIYESKNETIKKYSIYVFCLFLIFIIIILLLRK